ncbi:MAG TPA: tRNA pseudouridine(13) synthase TruD [Anaerolineae bacterium]|nr:tRNA pseudouridine(13) synthase TruD [Anaerolineae bacterium]
MLLNQSLVQSPVQRLVSIPAFALKTVNADFVVEEIYLSPRLTPQEIATQTYLWIAKEDLTTFELLRLLAHSFHLNETQVSAAGLKDEQAISRQLVSVAKILAAADIDRANAEFARQNRIILIENILGYGLDPVAPQMLHGNKFTLTLRDLQPDLAQRLEGYLAANKFFSFINYYDEQRFGLPNSIHNTAQIGQALLANNWETAYREYLRSGIPNDEISRAEAALAETGSVEAALRTVAASRLGFFVAAHQSRLWNQSLNQTIAQLPETIQVDFPHVGSLTLPTQPTAPLPALLSIEVVKKDWRTGLTYPDVKTRPALITVPVYGLNRFADDLHPGHRQAITLAFCLPTGCYATMLIKQLVLAVL